MRKILVGLLLVLGSISYGQSVTGTSGLIHIPSARMLEDGQLVLGAAYIPKPYFQRYGRSVNPGLNTYITYGILPFVEVMFRYTHELNMPVNPRTGYFPDRMLGLRVRLIDEKKYLPSMVIGLQDASAIIGNTCTHCSNYTATYLVLTKNLLSKFGSFDLSFGNAFDLPNLKSKDLKGFFGGFSFTPSIYNKIDFIAENDSYGINYGLKILIFNNINARFGYWRLKKTTFSLNIKI